MLPYMYLLLILLTKFRRSISKGILTEASQGGRVKKQPSRCLVRPAFVGV